MSSLVTAGSTVPDSFLKIPHHVVEDSAYSDTAVLLYAALCNHPGDQHGWIRKPHAHLARYLGWDTDEVKTDSAARRVARALKQLVAGGLVQVRWIREGLHKVPVYRVVVRDPQEGFEALPREIFTAARGAGMAHDGATLVRHWLRWRMAAGAAGWARPDCEVLARTFKLTAQAVAGRLEQLLAAGWIRQVTGIGGAALRFTTCSQAPAGPQRSVHQPPAQTANKVSTTTATKCPASSNHPASDNPSNDPSVGAPATTEQSVERETATAGKPPRTKNTRRHDEHHTTARRIIDAQPHLAGVRLTRVRHQATNLLAKRLRTAASRGLHVDPAQATAYIADRLEQAAQDELLDTNHCQLIRQAWANLRADTLAATTPDAVPATVTTPCPEPVTVPDGPHLEDLAALPAPSRRQAAADPAVAVDAVAGDLARWLLDQLDTDPEADVDQLLNLAQRRLERTLAGTPFQVATQFAPGMVRRAYQRSLLQQQADDLTDLDELRRIHALAVASLAQATAA